MVVRFDSGRGMVPGEGSTPGTSHYSEEYHVSESIEEQLARVPCPTCGNRTLVVELRLEARPLGTHSLSGTQLKTSARQWPYAVCTTGGCDFVKRAKVVDR